MAAERTLDLPQITDGKIPAVSARLGAYGSTYSKLWAAGNGRTDIFFRGTPAQWGPQLDRPTIDTTRKISRAHKEWTAGGNDDVHPRHIQYLSDGAVDAIIDLMMLCERTGSCVGRPGHHTRPLPT